MDTPTAVAKPLWAETRTKSISGYVSNLKDVFKPEIAYYNGYIEYCGKSRLSGTEDGPHWSLIDTDNKSRWALQGTDRLRKIRQHNAWIKQKLRGYPNVGPLGSNSEKKIIRAESLIP